VAEAAPEPDRHENAHERRVEDEVAGLAQIPALGRDRVAVALDAITKPLEGGTGLVDSRFDIRRGALFREAHEARETNRSLRRAGTHRIEVVLGARDDAAHKRD